MGLAILLSARSRVCVWRPVYLCVWSWYLSSAPKLGLAFPGKEVSRNAGPADYNLKLLVTCKADSECGRFRCMILGFLSLFSQLMRID